MPLRPVLDELSSHLSIMWTSVQENGDLLVVWEVALLTRNAKFASCPITRAVYCATNSMLFRYDSTGLVWSFQYNAEILSESLKVTGLATYQSGAACCSGSMHHNLLIGFVRGNDTSTAGIYYKIAFSEHHARKATADEKPTIHLTNAVMIPVMVSPLIPGCDLASRRFQSYIYGSECMLPLGECTVDGMRPNIFLFSHSSIGSQLVAVTDVSDSSSIKCDSSGANLSFVDIMQINSPLKNI